MYLWTIFALTKINKGDLYWKRETITKACTDWIAVGSGRRHGVGICQSKRRHGC